MAAGMASARSSIGLVLIGVATFLGREVKSLLVGESADASLVKVCEELAETRPERRARCCAC